MHVTFTGRRAVIFRNVHVRQLIGTVANCLDRILFFDVGVEGVVHHLQVRVVHLAAELRRIECAVREVTFEPVQILKTSFTSCLRA